MCLKVENVSYAYGGLVALKDVSLTVGEKEVVCLLGMNGAGKSTLLNLISALLRPQSGRIWWDGKPIDRLSPPRVVALGLVQVPEGRGLFGDMSVRENLELGAYLRLRAGQKRQVKEDMQRVLELLPELGQVLERPARELSGGQQQMLSIARALMARPRMLMMDEPSLGLAPKLAAQVFRFIRSLPAQGCSVLLVEQNALGALAVSDRGYILTRGRIRFSGTPQQILADPLLREAFLGPDAPATRAEGGRACAQP